jgi:hypothetical protein
VSTTVQRELDKHHGAHGSSVHDERRSPLRLRTVSPFLARVLPATEVARLLERADDFGCLRESVLMLWNQAGSKRRG